ncbi:Uncharacterised protein [Mycobacteroides abscessus subsp. abscessus]|nr:Uncharacterised protein [Mycobacteroides abscessus subsp. abscessus]
MLALVHGPFGSLSEDGCRSPRRRHVNADSPGRYWGDEKARKLKERKLVDCAKDRNKSPIYFCLGNRWGTYCAGDRGSRAALYGAG